MVDTGTWLPERLLLLSPHAFGRLDRYENTLHLKVSRAQVQASPALAADAPVSRPFEIEYHRYFRWPTYWNGSAAQAYNGQASARGPLPQKLPANPKLPAGPRQAVPLRRTRTLTRYRLQSPDGALGQLTSLLVDDQSWAIRQLVVASASGEILIPAGEVSHISDGEAQLLVNVRPASFATMVEPDRGNRNWGSELARDRAP